MTASKNIVFAGGRAKWVYQNGDGNVVLYHDGVPVWHSGTILKTLPQKPTPPPGDEPEGGGSGSDELDLSQVTWLHANISEWTASSTITKVRFPGGGSQLCIYHTQAGKWPKYIDNNTAGEGNAWVFAKISGQWYGGTFEWLRPGQECKPMITRENIGPHVKKSPLDSWVPKSGETVGFAMSTPARHHLRTSNERTNVVLVTWP